MASAYTLKDYLLNPDADPIKGITALAGKYRGSNYLSEVDASARGTFTLVKSIAKGTFRFGSEVVKALNDKTNFKQYLMTATDTAIGKGAQLIGAAPGKNFINFTETVLAEKTALFKDVTAKLASYAAAGQGDTFGQILSGASSQGIRDLKLKLSAMSVFNFKTPDIIRNAMIVDIETGGLGRNAPILQLAMIDMENLNQIDKLISTQEGRTSITRMSPSEQMEKGFLALDMMPTALLTDTAAENAAGEARERTYRVVEHTPESLDSFRTLFGGWAESKYDFLKKFYEENAGADGAIDDEKITGIFKKLEEQGFVELADGQRIYSQREAAKWSMIFAKQGSDNNKALIAANMTFESFRLGKLWEYFTQNVSDKSKLPNKNKFFTAIVPSVDDAGERQISVIRPADDGIGAHVRDFKGNYNVAMFPEDRVPLNQDPDIMKAFRTGPEGIQDLSEIRQMFDAYWKSQYKRNIMDPTNYHYTQGVDRLRMEGKTNEMISLFPMWEKNIGQGLHNKDQLELTKMLFSGLMQTGYIPTGPDVFSGTKIDWASRAFYGAKEEHLALMDTVLQGKLLTDAKLYETVKDVYTVNQGKETASIGGQMKSLIAATSILFDSKKRGWLSLTSYLKDTELEPITTDAQGRVLFDVDESSANPLLARWNQGTIGDVTKNYNIDKELLRIHETANLVSGQASLFDAKKELTVDALKLDEEGNPIIKRELPYPDEKPGKVIKLENAEGIVDEVIVNRPMPVADLSGEIQYHTEPINIQTDAYEPFNLGTRQGQVRHEKVTKDGATYSFFNKTHDYHLVDDMKKMHADLIAGGASAETAHRRVFEHMVGQYAESESIASRGLTPESLMERFETLTGRLREPNGSLGQKLTDELKLRFDQGDGALTRQIIEQTKGTLDQIFKNVSSKGYGLTIGGLGRGLHELSSSLSAVKFARPQSVGHFKAMASLTMQGLGKIKLQRETADRFLANAVSPAGAGGKIAVSALKDASWFVSNVGRTAGAIGGIVGAGLALAADYMIDQPSWKPTTEAILKKSGDEKQILEGGNYAAGGDIKSALTSYTAPIDKTNDAGVALQAVDGAKVDYAVGDGDTVELISKGFLGMGRRKLGSVRVSGIDTPETAHEGVGTGPGEMAYAQPGKNYLTNVLSARTGSQVVVGGRQTFGRSVGLITDQEGTNYSYEMVKQGLGSVLFREKSTEDLVSQTAYMQAEYSAKSKGKGMWSQPFYFGAQSGMGGAERKGWNTLSAFSYNRFHFDKSPGTSESQMIERYDQSPELNSINNLTSSSSQLNSITPITSSESGNSRKLMMAEMQQAALMGSMQRNRGRGKERR